MHQVHVHVPFPIERVSVRRRLAAEPELEDAAPELPVAAIEETLEDGYFAAGVREGRRQALAEVAAARAAEARSVEEALREFNRVLPELVALARDSFPQLLLTALGRVFREHRFTDDELEAEVGALLGEVGQAQSVVVELPPADLQAMERRIEKLGLSLQQGRLQWKANPSLSRGEYVLQTDLGMIDGRRLTKLARVRAALET